MTESPKVRSNNGSNFSQIRNRWNAMSIFIMDKGFIGNAESGFIDLEKARGNRLNLLP